MRKVLLIAIGLILVAGGFLLFRPRVDPVVIKPTTAPATQVAQAPATKPATAPARPVDFMDVVKRAYPDFPTTQPLMVPVAMQEAARLVIPDPMFLDAMGELWITRADAEATSVMFKSVHERSTHVLRDHVVFVHRYPDDRGVFQPQLICRREDGKYEIITRSARQEIESSYRYQWHRAYEWNDAVVVPTDRGVSIIRPDRRPMEIHHDFVSAEEYDPAKYSQVQSLLDWRGLVAWMPWEDGKLGSKGAARFLEDKWTVLDKASNWPEKLVHVVPLLDGSVLQIVLNEDQTTEVLLAASDMTPVDEKIVTDLVDQLSDPEATKREQAFGKLNQYGIGIWPLLERLLPNQTPEARVRIEQILMAKTQPHLAGMLLQPGPVKVLSRGDIGVVMLLAEKGVALPRMAIGDLTIVAPAIIAIVPGKSISLVPDIFAEEMKNPNRRLTLIRGEWIVHDDTQGPRWWLANHFSPYLLKPSEQEFKELIGLDPRGRWYFRKNATDLSPTLVLDPTLPSQTPRLPVWVYKVDEGGQVGWTDKDWPAIKLGGAWALSNNDWQPIDEEKGGKFITQIAVPAVEAPATAPTTVATTGPTTAQAVPLLAEANGTRFYDGMENLRMVKPDGKEVVWPLPPEAVGTRPPVLIRAGDNRLFLFNTPGRVLRIRQTDSDQPFKLEATFTHRIPNAETPQRIWLDPAGRIVVAYDNNSLAICFPSGRIPPDIARKMTSKDLSEAEAEK